jgi:hypothetical protein
VEIGKPLYKTTHEPKPIEAPVFAPPAREPVKVPAAPRREEAVVR